MMSQRNFCRLQMLHLLTIFLTLSASILAKGEPLDGNILRDEIYAAVKEGKSKFTIPPGTYRVTPPGNFTPHFTFNSVADFELDGTGVTFIFGAHAQAFELTKCRNFTIRGLTVDYDPLINSQGVVTSVDTSLADHPRAKVSQLHWFEVTVDEGYPIGFGFDRYMIFDREKDSGWGKRGNDWPWGCKHTWIKPNVIRIEREKGPLSAVELGDTIVLIGAKNIAHKGGGSHTFNYSYCENICTIDVTVRGGIGFVFSGGGGEGGHLFERVKIAYSPKPAGAVKECVSSSQWDGFHFCGLRHGPRIIDCETRGVSDDNVHLYGTYLSVREVEADNSLICATYTFRKDYVRETLKQGDIAKIHRGGVLAGEFAVNEITDIKDIPGSHMTHWMSNKKALGYLRIKPATGFKNGLVNIDDLIFFPAMSSSGFEIRGNKFLSPGRILIRASDGIVENNIIEDSAMHAIQVANESWNMDASDGRNVVIRNNMIRRYGSVAQQGAIFIVGVADGGVPSKDLFQNITIENNIFEDSNGPAITLAGVKGAKIFGNKIVRSLGHPPVIEHPKFQLKDTAAICLGTLSDVNIKDNQVIDPGVNMKSALYAKEPLNDVTGLDAAGITISYSNADTLPKGFALNKGSIPLCDFASSGYQPIAIIRLFNVEGKVPMKIVEYQGDITMSHPEYLEAAKKQSFIIATTPPLSNSIWFEYEFSFIPEESGELILLLAAPHGKPNAGRDLKDVAIVYDNISADGTTIINGNFEQEENRKPVGWLLLQEQYVVQEGDRRCVIASSNKEVRQVLNVEKNQTVTIRFSARNATVGEN